MTRSMWLDNLQQIDFQVKLSYRYCENLTGLLVCAETEDEFRYKYIGVIVKHVPRAQYADVYLTKIAK